MRRGKPPAEEAGPFPKGQEAPVVEVPKGAGGGGVKPPGGSGELGSLTGGDCPLGPRRESRML